MKPIATMELIIGLMVSVGIFGIITVGLLLTEIFLVLQNQFNK